jgi:hypothetical protein
MNNNNNDIKMPAANGAVLRQAGCNSADSLVGIWKCIARMNISEPPPERKAAKTLAASGESVVEKVSQPEKRVHFDSEVKKNIYPITKCNMTNFVFWVEKYKIYIKFAENFIVKC